jgi:hypothetical protein
MQLVQIVKQRFSDWRDRIFHREREYKYIVVGGGTSGCITAYWIAKLMTTNNIPGRVLLIGNNYAFVIIVIYRFCY